MERSRRRMGLAAIVLCWPGLGEWCGDGGADAGASEPAAPAPGTANGAPCCRSSGLSRSCPERLPGPPTMDTAIEYTNVGSGKGKGLAGGLLLAKMTEELRTLPRAESTAEIESKRSTAVAGPGKERRCRTRKECRNTSTPQWQERPALVRVEPMYFLCLVDQECREGGPEMCSSIEEPTRRRPAYECFM